VKDQVEYLWCRVEEEGGRVNRVDVMHPNGEILFSYPPERFEVPLLRRMQAGQIRGRLSEGASDAGAVLSLVDDAGNVVFSEGVSTRSISSSRDAGER
jgi:hypothetical protein